MICQFTFYTNFGKDSCISELFRSFSIDTEKPNIMHDPCRYKMVIFGNSKEKCKVSLEILAISGDW